MSAVKDKNEVRKVPELRFPEFDGEWEEKRFSDLYDFGSTNSLSRDKLTYEKGLIYNIHYGDIHTKYFSHFKLSNEKVPFIADSNFDLPNGNSLVEKGDIVIADASEDYEDIGKTIEIVSTGDASIVSGLHTILGKRKSNLLSFGFMGHMMKNSLMRLRIKRIAQGVKVLGLPKKYIIDLIINLPALHEQQKIADFLSSVDEWINSLKGQKEKLEAYKKGMMQKIFSQEIRFKNDNGDDFPEWEEKRLGDVAKIYDGTHQTPKYVKTGVPFYSVEHLTANDFINTKYISEEVFERENKRVKLEKGDILMTRIGSIGTARLIDWEVKASFYVSLSLIKASRQLCAQFFAQYIESIDFQKELWKRTIHVAFPKKINLGEISHCLLVFPTLPEQQKIADFLSSLDKIIEAKLCQIIQTQNWKKGLMQQLFV